jgi:HrpA-like RNA helicase
MDRTNRTYCVGQDSDYCVFGFKTQSLTPEDEGTGEGTTRGGGDDHGQVQYMPLDEMSIEQNGIRGHVLTRRRIAQELDIAEHLIVEACILAGNDYTKSFVQEKASSKVSINFFRNFISVEPKDRFTIRDIFEALSFIGDSSSSSVTSTGSHTSGEFQFLVESTDPKQQSCIEYSRILFQLEDVSSYLEEKEDTTGTRNDEALLDETINDVVRIDNGDTKDENEDLSRRAVARVKKYMNATIAGDDEDQQEEEMDEKSSSDYLKSCLVAAFEGSTIQDEIDVVSVLQDMYSAMMKKEDTKSPAPPQSFEDMYNAIIRAKPSESSDIIPFNLQWSHVQLSNVYQKCVRTAMRLASQNWRLAESLSPCMFFDHLSFYHSIANRMKIQGAVQKDDSTQSIDPTSKLEEQQPLHHPVHQSLPIDEHRLEILNSVKRNRVTIIQGETGSGKSSRVPVMLLEAPSPSLPSKESKMFICQPRRIAAKSLVERIRNIEPHLKDQIGLRMGHGVREYESRKTRAWFVTSGYLVRYLAGNPEKFDKIDYLIIDEVHERSIESDILCLLAKRLLETHPTIRIVLMSATVAAEMYQSYFNVPEPPIFVGVRCHPIQEFFAEDIGKSLHLSPKDCQSLCAIRESCDKNHCQSAPNTHYIEKLHHLAVQIVLEVGKGGSSVLVFVSGMFDIVSITEIFENIVSSMNYKCVPIHSDIPFDDQMQAFDSAQKNEVKVILATNAAESSITLPDVDNVICLGLCKAIGYNKKSHRQMLETSWISKANATQRAGRTGRVREGNVYRLYSRDAFNYFFRNFEEGEILRSPLDSVILDLKAISPDASVSQSLRDCIEPPDIQNIESSYVSLFKKGFATTACEAFDITPLGHLVLSLGIDLTIGAMVGFGVQLGLLRETIEIAAILSFPKSPWLLPNSFLQSPNVYNGEKREILDDKLLL